MNLNQKTILIVGGASGIGKATAELCAAAGADLWIADRDATAGAALASALGARFCPVDVTDADSVRALFAQIGAQRPRLDALIHTAGIMQGAFVPLEEFGVDMFRRVVDVNLTGSFLCSKHALPLLRQSPRGVIVLVSSIAAVQGSSSFAYGASKGGVSALGITLANRLANDGIRVNVVVPGNIDTPMKQSVIEAERQRIGPGGEQQSLVLGEPIGVARVLAWLASDDADYVRGAVFTR